MIEKLLSIIPRNSKGSNAVRLRSHHLGSYAFNDGDVRKQIIDDHNFDGDLLNIFTNGCKHPVHKWHHYLPIYDKYFREFRDTPFRFLEIGVSQGGSIDMWREYFGDQAIIYGIDINENCASLNGQSGQIRIGSQSDESFLLKVVEEMGGLDVVLDDGSHKMKDITATLEILFPLLNERGVYMIEDLHTSYLRKFGGGYWGKRNFFNYLRNVFDDVHSWYHYAPIKHPKVSDYCSSIHIYDSICVFERGKVVQPKHSVIQNST
ncbi:MAG: hypothetical protein OXH57_09190 [Ekhidna sp.]|nr:hypothetical protein [Ekhidna sp.]